MSIKPEHIQIMVKKLLKEFSFSFYYVLKNVDNQLKTFCT